MPLLSHIPRANLTCPQRSIKTVGGKLTIEKIVKLLIYKIKCMWYERVVLKELLCPGNNLAEGSFERKGNSVTNTTESYGTNIPCTSLVGDKWEVGNGGKRQEDSGRLFVNTSAWVMAVQWSLLAPSVFLGLRC